MAKSMNKGPDLGFEFELRPAADAHAGSILIGRFGGSCGSLYLSNERCRVTDDAICAGTFHQE